MKQKGFEGKKEVKDELPQREEEWFGFRLEEEGKGTAVDSNVQAKIHGFMLQDQDTFPNCEHLFFFLLCVLKQQ
jgi:hypothetical protein